MASKKRVTMADVAREAGVHHTTVSLALRQHPSLPAETQKRIQILAAQMGYRVDPALRALNPYRHHSSPPVQTPRIAFVTSGATRFGWRHVPAHKQFYRGAASRAKELGYHLVHLWLDAPEFDPAELSNSLSSNGVQGLLLSSHDSPNHRALSIDWSRLCAVQIEHLPGIDSIGRVTNDQPAAIETAVRKALQAGYHRVGLVLPQWWNHLVDSAWTIGFLAAQQKIPPENRVPPLLYSATSEAPGPQVPPVPTSLLAKWLSQYRVDAVMSHAPAVEPALEILNLKVPQDIALADVFLRDEDRDRIAGVRQNCEHVGALSVDRLHQQLLDPSGSPAVSAVRTLVEGTWIDGNSLPPSQAGGP
ncbi:LacI family DNA-binding transcriptional regulator [Synoicihabitans lomoniglobus]|uniref:LacI family DNA-binding transcriptional regulator n=1 Tax=Synoicihabitans lomoniglobus TaxID=2909285 RepID=A0AAE9ZZ37_9BACT|nr:LacI family transcriptional regulator [Opitutaceae bacterium LMO-M01]WED63127.1 LacI family DNA-binding transcriptional regulator [Opitutaceae bacterium LMO-M01]